MPRSASSQKLINKLLTAISGEIGLLSALEAMLVGHEDESIPNTKKFKKYLENILKDLNDQKGCSALEDLRLKIEVTYVAIALHGTIRGENLLNKIGRVLADEINSDVSNFQRNKSRGRLNKFFPPVCLKLSETLFSIDVIQCNHPDKDKDRVIWNLLGLLKSEKQSYESLLKKTTEATEEYKINLQKYEIKNALTSSSLTTPLDEQSLSHIFHYAGVEEPKPDKEINEPQRQYDRGLKDEQDEQKKTQGVQDRHTTFWQKHPSRPKGKLEDLQKDQIEMEDLNKEREPSTSHSPTET